MRHKSFCNRERLAVKSRFAVGTSFFVFLLFAAATAYGGDAPSWMHAAASAAVPDHDDKTDAALLYSETNVTVISADKMKTVERRVYKILRPDGREYGIAGIPFNAPWQKVNGLHGWCIPASGKDYEVKDKDAIESAYLAVDGGDLISDLKVKLLRIPAADPGNIVGYEYEIEEDPLVLESEWFFQGEAPVRESHYSLRLPSGWEFRSTMLNHPDLKPTETEPNHWVWVVSNVKGIRKEEQMPPLRGLLGHMMVSLLPPEGPGSKGFTSWRQMGSWYQQLTSARKDASPDLQQKVATLTVAASTPLEKMRVLSGFVQNSIRYVAIELGIGGVQPHTASETFSRSYGDCKDKATLLSAMLHEAGIDSYYVVINDERGSVSPLTPASIGVFNHVILAIKLPDGLNDPSLFAVMHHPSLGNLLFFDPTNELTPFGQIGGYLQENYGLLVTPSGGELIQLPKQPSGMNGVRRSAKLHLDTSGTLTGDVEEFRVGDRAWDARWRLHQVTNDKDRIKPIESLLAGSLPNFQITKAAIVNFAQTNQPFGFRYSFAAQSYAKSAGNFLLVRPRVLGVKSQPLLETKEPRQFPIEFDGPVRDTDSFEIIIPDGYVVDDIPAPVDADFGFASYHSKTEVKGNLLDYTRTFEVTELSVPVDKADELKKFYRIIATDERNTAVLKPVK